MSEPKNMTLLELSEARVDLGRALNDVILIEAKLSSIVAQLDLALLRHPENPINQRKENHE
jgi:hypothetical protein